METGYLLIEIAPDRPGLVHLGSSGRLPPLAAPGLAWVARCEDIDAALMHCHEGLKRRLVDLDRRLYRATPVEAVAVAAAIGLPYRQVFLDPALAADPALARLVSARRAQARLRARLADGVGLAALLWLFLLLLGGW